MIDATQGTKREAKNEITKGKICVLGGVNQKCLKKKKKKELKENKMVVFSVCKNFKNGWVKKGKTVKEVDFYQ